MSGKGKEMLVLLKVDKGLGERKNQGARKGHAESSSGNFKNVKQPSSTFECLHFGGCFETLFHYSFDSA